MIRIFISSVQKEFAGERKALCSYIREDSLLSKFFKPFLFEELPAIDLSAQDAYLTEAAQSEIYLGIYGEQYGFEDAEGVSPTEREFDTATANNRSISSYPAKSNVSSSTAPRSRSPYHTTRCSGAASSNLLIRQ